MRRISSQRVWVLWLLVGLYFLVTNALDGDWIMVGLAVVVVVLSAYGVLRPRPPA